MKKDYNYFIEKYLNKTVTFIKKPDGPWSSRCSPHYPMSMNFKLPFTAKVVDVQHVEEEDDDPSLGVEIDGTVYGFTATHFEQFLGEKQEAPKRFRIQGEYHHIRCIIQDLKKVGYNLCGTVSNTMNGLSHQFVKINPNKSEYRELYIEHTAWTPPRIEEDIVYSLPEDYSAAYKHAKEAIESNYWKKLEPVNIGGYTADYGTHGGVKFGCTSFSREQVIAVRDNLSDITIEKLDEILKNM